MGVSDKDLFLAANDLFRKKDKPFLLTYRPPGITGLTTKAFLKPMWIL